MKDEEWIEALAISNTKTKLDPRLKDVQVMDMLAAIAREIIRLKEADDNYNP